MVNSKRKLREKLPCGWGAIMSFNEVWCLKTSKGNTTIQSLIYYQLLIHSWHDEMQLVWLINTVKYQHIHFWKSHCNDAAYSWGITSIPAYYYVELHLAKCLMQKGRSSVTFSKAKNVERSCTMLDFKGREPRFSQTWVFVPENWPFQALFQLPKLHHAS